MSEPDQNVPNLVRIRATVHQAANAKALLSLVTEIAKHLGAPEADFKGYTRDRVKHCLSNEPDLLKDMAPFVGPRLDDSAPEDIPTGEPELLFPN